MHIQSFGYSCIKLTAKTAGRGSEDVIVLFAPFDKKTGQRPPQGQADVVLESLDHPEFSGSKKFRGEPQIMSYPGEYAVKGVNIIGFPAPADPRSGQDRGLTTIYILDIEDMKVVHLGALGMELEADQYEKCFNPDILFLPIGDNAGLDGKTAETIARKLEPRVIIPTHYKSKGITGKNLRDASDFCGNIGNCPKESEEKITIKKSDLGESVMQVRMLAIS